MLNFNINLTSLAVILWSGMLIISGSIWVLSSQVRKVADLLEEHARGSARMPAPAGEIELAMPAARVARRGATARVRSAGRAQLAPPRRPTPLVSRIVVSEGMNGRSSA